MHKPLSRIEALEKKVDEMYSDFMKYKDRQKALSYRVIDIDPVEVKSTTEPVKAKITEPIK